MIKQLVSHFVVFFAFIEEERAQEELLAMFIKDSKVASGGTRIRFR